MNILGGNLRVVDLEMLVTFPFIQLTLGSHGQFGLVLVSRGGHQLGFVTYGLYFVVWLVDIVFGTTQTSYISCVLHRFY